CGIQRLLGSVEESRFAVKSWVMGVPQTALVVPADEVFHFDPVAVAEITTAARFLRKAHDRQVDVPSILFAPEAARARQAEAARGQGEEHPERIVARGDQVREMADREEDILVALSRLNANGQRRRVSRRKAALKADPGCTPSSYNKAIAAL